MTAKRKKPKKYRKREKVKPIREIQFNLPRALKTYLNDKEILLLKGMLANYTIQDMAVITGYNRKNIMERLIDLGRALHAFELAEQKIFPENVPSADYLVGFNDCKRLIRRLINERLNWRKTVKNRNP